MRRNILIILTTLVVFIITSCSSRPTYYSKSEIKSFVKEKFGTEYKLNKVEKSEDSTPEKNTLYEYIFKNNEGFEFSIYSSTTHSTFDATELKTYEKKLETNYLTAMIDYKSNELNSIINTLSFNANVNSKNENIDLYLTNFNQLEEATDTIIKIDELFSFNYKNSSDIGKVWINVHYNSSDLTHENNKNYASTLSLSNDDNSRLEYSTVLVKLKNEINNYISRSTQ